MYSPNALFFEKKKNLLTSTEYTIYDVPEHAFLLPGTKKQIIVQIKPDSGGSNSLYFNIRPVE